MGWKHRFCRGGMAHCSRLFFGVFGPHATARKASIATPEPCSIGLGPDAIMRTSAGFREHSGMMSRPKDEAWSISRRAMLKDMGLAPLLLRPAPFFGSSWAMMRPVSGPGEKPAFPFTDVRLTPHYPAKSP